MTRPILHAIAIAVVLGAIATVAPAPSSSDQDMYERVGRQVFIPRCSDIHCFRVLIAAGLEHLPGPGFVKWKAYAVLANTAAALAVGRFCVLLGLSGSAAAAAAWICALGAGSLYSLFDCYTSDPFMYLIGPLVAVAVWQGRVARAGVLGTIGVFAKEFAWAPLWIFALMAVLERRRDAARRLVVAAAIVSAVWAAWHFGLILLLHYGHGATRSTHLLDGGYFRMWIVSVGAVGAIVYLFTTFGALYIPFAGGLVTGGSHLRRLAVASLPAAAAFLYVQQPERALWNFHFIVIPIAMVALRELPDWALALFAATFGAANLRFGAQLPLRAGARVALAASVVLGAAALALALARSTRRSVEPSPAW